jgi:hypothetical protein
MKRFLFGIVAACVLVLAGHGVSYADSCKATGNNITVAASNGSGSRNVTVVDTNGTTHNFTVPDPSTLLNKLNNAAGQGAACTVTIEYNNNDQITGVKGCNTMAEPRPIGAWEPNF